MSEVEAKQLEKACLAYIKNHMEDPESYMRSWLEMQEVVVTPAFGTLSKDWPQVRASTFIFMMA